MMPFIYYLLKITFCSGIFFLYYHLALRNKVFHQLNRFFLLAAVLISISVSFVQFNIYHDVLAPSNGAIKLLQVVESANGYLEEVPVNSHKIAGSIQWIYIAYL